jgi:hypothetical protein
MRDRQPITISGAIATAVILRLTIDVLAGCIRLIWYLVKPDLDVSRGQKVSVILGPVFEGSGSAITAALVSPVAERSSRRPGQ